MALANQIDHESIIYMEITGNSCEKQNNLNTNFRWKIHDLIIDYNYRNINIIVLTHLENIGSIDGI